MDVRVLMGEPHDGDLTDEDLDRLYEAPSPWLRANMVATLDGAANGSDGKTGTINNSSDKRVFDLLRRWSEAIVVGAGTARIEGYGESRKPTVVVTRRGHVPERLRDAAPGKVFVATCASAAGLDETRGLLGVDHCLVAGDDEVDLAAVRRMLEERGMNRLLTEGGPQLLGTLIAAGVVDELCLTVVPDLVSGVHPRITSGPDLDVTLEPRLLLEERGTLLGRWFVNA